MWKSRWPSWVPRPNEPCGFRVDVKQHWTMHTHWSQFVPNMSTQHPRTLSFISSPSTVRPEQVSRFGAAVRRYSREAAKQKDLGSTPLRLSSVFKQLVICRHCLVTLSLTVNETLKWLSSLPSLMQELFWWWQCSDRYIISLFRHLHTPLSPFFPSLISLSCGFCGR